MPTNRNARRRERRKATVSPLVLDIFARMESLTCECTGAFAQWCEPCEKWKGLERHLGRAMGLRPMDYPAYCTATNSQPRKCSERFDLEPPDHISLAARKRGEMLAAALAERSKS
jgi:hypothetical protein